jgi:hypothetical protein
MKIKKNEIEENENQQRIKREKKEIENLELKMELTGQERRCI